MLFPKTLAGLKSLALKCQRAAESCEGGFKDLADLTQELVMVGFVNLAVFFLSNDIQLLGLHLQSKFILYLEASTQCS